MYKMNLQFHDVSHNFEQLRRGVNLNNIQEDHDPTIVMACLFLLQAPCWYPLMYESLSVLRAFLLQVPVSAAFWLGSI